MLFFLSSFCSQFFFFFGSSLLCAFFNKQPHSYILFIKIEERKEKRLHHINLSPLFSFLSLIIIIIIIILALIKRQRRRTPVFFYSVLYIVASRERIRKEERLILFVLAHPRGRPEKPKIGRRRRRRRTFYYIYKHLSLSRLIDKV